MNVLPTSHFCSVPWEYLEVVATGDVYVCCNGRQKKPVGNIWQSDLKAIWDGRNAGAARQSIRDGRFDNCGPCIYLDKKGGRVTSIDKLSIDEESYLNGGLPYRPKLLWLLIDRSCQLKCGSCRKDFLVERKTDKIFALRDKVLGDPFLAGVETLWIDGSGEPLISQAHLDLIRHSDTLMPAGPNIGILTNGLNFQNVWNELSQPARDRVRHVTVSVDAATQDTYELNRPPAKWNKLCQALWAISGLKTSGLLDSFKMVMAVQSNNWREMGLFCTSAKTVGAQPWFTALTNWGTWTDEQYKERAVHLPGHPDHLAFRQLLQSSIFSEPGVLQYVLV